MRRKGCETGRRFSSKLELSVSETSLASHPKIGVDGSRLIKADKNGFVKIVHLAALLVRRALGRSESRP